MQCVGDVIGSEVLQIEVGWRCPSVQKVEKPAIHRERSTSLLDRPRDTQTESRCP